MGRSTGSIAIVAMLLIVLLIAVIPASQPADASAGAVGQPVVANTDAVSGVVVAAGSQPPVAQVTIRPIATLRITIVPRVTLVPFRSPSASPTALPSSPFDAVNDQFYATSTGTSTYVGNVLTNDEIETYSCTNQTLEVVSAESNDFDMQIDSAGNVYLKEYRPGYWQGYSTTYHLHCYETHRSPPVTRERLSNEATVRLTVKAPPPPTYPPTAPPPTPTPRSDRGTIFATLTPRITPQPAIRITPIGTTPPLTGATSVIPSIGRTPTPTRPSRP